MPFVALAFHRAATRITPRSLVAGGLFYGLALLDGGPYVVGFPVVFLGLYAGLLALRARTLRPLLACAAVLGIGAAIAAIQIVPIAETFFSYRRETPAASHFYRAPFELDWLSMLYQGLVSRQQAHDPKLWMPYVLNVGSYVGWLPLLLSGVAVVARPGRVWPVAVTGFVSLWIHLGNAAPFDLWAVFHELPILGSLQVPARFNVFAVLSLALLAGHGLEALRERRRFGPPVAVALVAIVAADMTAVNAPVFKVAFSIPPVAVREPGSFFHHQRSPYEDGWADRALYPIFPNWPNVTYASTLENTGVIEAWHNLKYPRRVVPRDHALYPGAEVWSVSAGLRVTNASITPNVVEIEVEGDAGLVAINQNFHPGWKVVGGTGRIADLDGLVSVFVPAGAQRLKVAFRPRSFELGASISLLALLLAAFALWLDRPGRQRR